MSLTQPVERIRVAMGRMADVVASIRRERAATAAAGDAAPPAAPSRAARAGVDRCAGSVAIWRRRAPR